MAPSIDWRDGLWRCGFTRNDLSPNLGTRINGLDLSDPPDVLTADNRCSLHRAGRDESRHHRRLHRIILIDDQPPIPGGTKPPGYQTQYDNQGAAS